MKRLFGLSIIVPLLPIIIIFALLKIAWDKSDELIGLIS